MIITQFVELIKNLPFRNLDLLAVGISIAAISILGLVIFLNDRGSLTNRTFLALSISATLWGIVNYISYQTNNYVDLTLWLLRLVLFFAIWFAYYLFKLTYVFPENDKVFPRLYKFFLVPSVFLTSLFTLTPYIFPRIVETSAVGFVSKTEVLPGIYLFGIVAFILIFGSFYNLIRKTLAAKPEEKSKYRLMLYGTIITFSLIITFNFVFAGIFLNVRYIPLGGLFIFPFVAFTAYAVYKHKTFHVRNIASATLAFLLCLATFIEIIFADSISLMIFRASVFMLVLIISIQFIRNIFSLELANEQKSEFMSFASHEIRAPITAMKGYASLMLEGDMGEINPQVKDASQKILISSNNVVSLISQYLNKSKMELGELSYTMTEFDMGKMVKDAVQSFQVNADQKGITLTADVDAGATYTVNADEGKIREVIGNLIDNAVKYTPEKGSAVVSVTQKDGKVLVKVSDTGHGIPKEVMSKLFKKFSRADAQKANLLGTGLGLYLSKTFIDAHKDGRIWAESSGEGKGSQFYVELPAKQVSEVKG